MQNPLFIELANSMPEDPQLTDAERNELLRLCQPGNPLWKIVKSSVDYANHMRDHIAAIPLVTAEDIASARQLQLRREAALAHVKWMAQVIQGSGPKPRNGKGQDNGI